MSRIHLEILSPTRRLYEGDVDAVVAPGSDGGLFGVKPRHAPMLVAMRPGELSYTIDGKQGRFAVAQGFITIENDQVSVLADAAEPCDEIDVPRAQRAAEDARQKLATFDPAAPSADQEAEQIRLERAETRLRVAEERLKGNLAHK